MDAPETVKFGWHYPAGATAGSPVDEGPPDTADAPDDGDACYPYECRRGKPCCQHYSD